LIGEARSTLRERAPAVVSEKDGHVPHAHKGSSDQGAGRIGGKAADARLGTRQTSELPSDRGPTIGAIYEPEVSVTGKREAEELLLIEEADAWFEYLEATRAQSAVRYKEVEPWAWARLQQRMRAIRARRAKLRPAAA
jgi:hypothetical protein